MLVIVKMILKHKDFPPHFLARVACSSFSEYILPTRTNLGFMYFRGKQVWEDLIFLFPHKTKIILSKLEVNDKLLWYFIWSKYFKQNTETTKIIM